MKRDKAIEAMDLLASQGYTATIMAHPYAPGDARAHGEGDVGYRVDVRALSFDSIDLRHLCDQADALGLHCYTGRLVEGAISFADPDSTPAVVRSPRRHPR